MIRTSARLGAAAVSAVALLALAGPASAHHPEHEVSTREDFPGEGVGLSSDKQHDGDEGHLPARSENVRVVGKAEVTNPANPTPEGNVGRVADVFAFGNFAYLNAFREPDCTSGGVHVMNIRNLRKPVEIKEAFIPTSPGSYAGEGIQVLKYNNKFFKGDLLIHQNETCPGATPAAGTVGGINLWDVTNPRKPVNVGKHVGDYTSVTGATEANANTVHSMYGWSADGKTYVALVDNEEFADVDIMDITDPFNPVMINDTLDLIDLFDVQQTSPGGLNQVFSHDMTVVKVENRWVMNVNYWDGGYVLLDVTDPVNVTLIAESDYGTLDEERLARGQSISPEGNAHQSELSPERDFLIGTDEDFNPYRVSTSITSGPNAGATFQAIQAPATPQIGPDRSVEGSTVYIGRACTADGLPAGNGGIALIERGDCTFQEKLDAAKAAGFGSAIVFNNVRADCTSLVSMLATSDIPALFVSRPTGLRMLGQTVGAAPCSQPGGLAIGDAGSDVSIKAIFDGWGYVRLFRTDIPATEAGVDTPKGSIAQVDTYAIEESQDPKYATGFGDLSVHEVAMDNSREGIAYLSYYAGGLRVVEYGKNGIKEVGSFIDEGGNNFWGVEVIKRGGKSYVLASDRDYGLYIFEYDPEKKHQDRP